MNPPQNQPKDQPLVEAIATNEPLDNKDAPLTILEISTEQIPALETTPDEPVLLTEPQPQYMEVHHHGHVRHQKKWKEYLFQFLMLFLAVFCGFFAEYQLEHVIEHNREKEYIRSMVADLKEDTARISNYLNNTLERYKGRDSLMDLLNRPLLNDDTIKRAYQLVYNNAFARAKFYFTDRTLTQLKNAGGLRLIRNQAASDSIITYDKEIQHVEYISEAYEASVNDGMKNCYDVFNLSYRRHPNQFNNPDFKPNLLTNDQSLINRYLNSLVRWNFVANNYFNTIRAQRERAIRLINTLKEEYRLKDQ